ncbi:MAG: hypothetical protein KTM48_03045, partial [Wolbachia endosymbiont of Pissodes strobi]|nr:hypothetical protein [Wolbachia endosymbiont of Pissodes strobi]
VSRNNQLINTSVYRKPTYTGHYIKLEPNHSFAIELGIIKTPCKRATTLCSHQVSLIDVELGNIKMDLFQNGYTETSINKSTQNCNVE